MVGNKNKMLIKQQQSLPFFASTLFCSSNGDGWDFIGLLTDLLPVCGLLVTAPVEWFAFLM